MRQSYNKRKICIFIILFISFVPSLVVAKTADEWSNEGLDLAYAGRYTEAIRAFDEALKINPQFDEAWYNKGVSLGRLKRYEEAIKAYDETLKINPQHYKAWNNKGIALSGLGRDEEAIRAFDEALKINPQYGEAWYNKALVLDYLERYEEANIAFDKSLEKATGFEILFAIAVPVMLIIFAIAGLVRLVRLLRRKYYYTKVEKNGREI